MAAKTTLRTCALLGSLLLGAGPVFGGSNLPGAHQSQANARIAAPNMGEDSGRGNVPQGKRMEMSDFVAGNMLFVLLHEMGHVHVTEMGLPVLGREEDAADAFATVAMLKTGSEFSYNVLLDAAKAWFLSAERDQKKGKLLAFHDEHSLDRQRAYQIVCLMVGAEPEQFRVVADWVKMPNERQQTCQGDYSNASWSWDRALKPYQRTVDQPRTKIETIYAEGKGRLADEARALRAVRLLETVAERAAEEYVWRAPFTLEMRTCGHPAAHWDVSTRRLTLCYEMAEEFAQLYRDDPVRRVAANDLISRNITALRVQNATSVANVQSRD